MKGTTLFTIDFELGPGEVLEPSIAWILEHETEPYNPSVIDAQIKFVDRKELPAPR